MEGSISGRILLNCYEYLNICNWNSLLSSKLRHLSLTLSLTLKRKGYSLHTEIGLQPQKKPVPHEARVFSHIVLFKWTKLSSLKVDQKVDQHKRDSVLFAFTLSVHLKSSALMGPHSSFCSYYRLSTVVPLEHRSLLLWIMGSFHLEQDGCYYTCLMHIRVVFG